MLTFDVDFTYELPMVTKTKTFKGVSLLIFYHLREKYFQKYGKDMISVDAFIHGTDKRVDALSWFYEQEYDWQMDIWEHDGI